MFVFNYSVGDIKNSELGEGIVCLGEGSGGKGGREVGGRGEGSGGKGGGKWGKGEGSGECLPPCPPPHERPHFSDVSRYMHIFFVQRVFVAACSLGIQWIDWYICLTTSNKWVLKSKGSIWMDQHFRRSSIWMGLFFSKARNMNGVGFEILARTPVPQLPPSYLPLPTPRDIDCNAETVIRLAIVFADWPEYLLDEFQPIRNRDFVIWIREH